MQYNEEQRAIIRRMGEISARHRAAMEADQAAHAAIHFDLLNFATELAAVIRRSNEIGALQTEYGDAFREFLDTFYEKADIAPLRPVLCSIKAGEAVLGRSERFIIDAIARGLIRAVKSDRRTLLIVSSLYEYAESLAKNSPAKGTLNTPSRRKPKSEAVA